MAVRWLYRIDYPSSILEYCCCPQDVIERQRMYVEAHWHVSLGMAPSYLLYISIFSQLQCEQSESRRVHCSEGAVMPATRCARDVRHLDMSLIIHVAVALSTRCACIIRVNVGNRFWPIYIAAQGKHVLHV